MCGHAVATAPACIRHAEFVAVRRYQLCEVSTRLALLKGTGADGRRECLHRGQCSEYFRSVLADRLAQLVGQATARGYHDLVAVAGQREPFAPQSPKEGVGVHLQPFRVVNDDAVCSTKAPFVIEGAQGARFQNVGILGALVPFVGAFVIR